MICPNCNFMIRDGGVCMRCNKGQLAGYEALIILILLSSVGGLSYLLITKKSDANIYQAQSKPRVTQLSPDEHFGCQNIRIDEYMEGLKDVNKVSR